MIESSTQRQTFLILLLTYQFVISVTETKALRIVLHGIVAGITMQIPLQNPNACDHSDIECPLKKGQVYSHGYEIEVRNSYPVVSNHSYFNLSKSFFRLDFIYI